MLDRTIAPEVHTIGNLTLPRPNTITLDNGVQLHYLDGGSQEVSQLSILWPGGTAESAVAEQARLMAAVMTEGTSSRSGERISDEMDFHGAMLRVLSGSHHTELQLTSLNSMAEGVLPVVTDILHNASFADDMLAVYRSRHVQDLLLSQSNVNTLARDAVAPLIMGADHPMAHVETPEEIESVDRAAVAALYCSTVQASGCQALLSGRITDRLLTEVTDVLGTLPAGKSVNFNLIPYCPQAPQRVDVHKEGAVQAAVVAELPAIPRSHPDYVPLRFAVIALGGYFGSRLMKNIREDKGYTYGIGAYLAGALEGGTVSIMAQTDARYVDALIDEMRAEIRLLGSEPLGREELMSLKQYIASTLMEYLDSPFATMDYYKTKLVVDIPDDYFTRQVELARNCDAALIQQMASKYLDSAALRIAVAK